MEKLYGTSLKNYTEVELRDLHQMLVLERFEIEQALKWIEARKRWVLDEMSRRGMSGLDDSLPRRAS